MVKSEIPQDFVYVTFIRTTPEKLWDSLTNPEFTKQYWFGISVQSDWKVGSPVTYVKNGTVVMAGKILEAKRPEILSYTFHEEQGESSSEPPTKAVMKIEQDPRGDMVKLTITHTDFIENSKHHPSISRGWPAVLSGLKTLLETGTALPF